VAAYLSKTTSISALAETLRRVAVGERLLTCEHIARILDEQNRQSIRTTGLTARERDILSSITRGDSNREIALQLGLSEKTVKNYVSQVLDKLDVRDRTSAAMVAIERSLAGPGEWRGVVDSGGAAAA
jgi:DNA-binding NarL/FixJ family response regulator